jgi:hypothetical protein
MFTARHEHRVINTSHDLPRDATSGLEDAVLTVNQWSRAAEHG